jgi:HSP20 family protein
MMQLFRANADLYETDNGVVAKFDLPGVNSEDIDVRIENQNLVIRVERTKEIEERRENAFISERAFSGYYRSIPIPDEADLDNASAEYEDGVLTVRFPFMKEARRGQRIEGGSRGVPITPHQERLGREQMLEQGTDSPLYRSGTGSYYSDTFVNPTGEAAPESSFSAGSAREEELAMREAAVARREAEVGRREMSMTQYQQRLSREDMMRQGTDSPLYRSGTGSYYSETFERPTGEAAPGSAYSPGSLARAAAVSKREIEVSRREAEVGRKERVISRSGPSADQYQQRMSRDDMMRQGSDSPLYRPGGGSYYSETFEKPSGTAGPQSSFGRKEVAVEGPPAKKKSSKGKKAGSK